MRRLLFIFIVLLLFLSGSYGYKITEEIYYSYKQNEHIFKDPVKLSKGRRYQFFAKRTDVQGIQSMPSFSIQYIDRYGRLSAMNYDVFPSASGGHVIKWDYIPGSDIRIKKIQSSGINHRIAWVFWIEENIIFDDTSDTFNFYPNIYLSKYCLYDMKVKRTDKTGSSSNATFVLYYQTPDGREKQKEFRVFPSVYSGRTVYWPFKPEERILLKKIKAYGLERNIEWRVWIDILN